MAEPFPIVKCGICLEIFINPCHLPCTHLFCKECLESWISEKDIIGSLVCPSCKIVTPIPSEGINAFVQIDMSEKVQVDYTKKLCSKCTTNTDIKAKVYCQNCLAFLCGACFDSHEVWLKHHNTATVEDLSSGKVQITKMEDQMCTKHEGEQNKFYCITCQQLVCRDCILIKQHCRDHDYVTLKEAAEEKLSAVKQAIKECDDKTRDCREVIHKAPSASTQLVNDFDIAKKSYIQAKTDYMKQVDNFYAKLDNASDQLKKNHKAKLDTSKNSAKDMLLKIQNASSQGQALVESGSHYNILANSKSVLEALHQVNQMTLNEVDASLVKFPTSVSMGEFNQPWKQIGGFKVDCKDQPTGIAVTSDGKVAVCDCYDCVKVLTQDGGLLHTFDGMLGGLGAIGITYDDTYVYPLTTHEGVKHKSNFQVISKFKTVNANKDTSEARAVTVDKNGMMIFGMADNAISIHNPDGSLKRSYAIPYEPYSVAVTSNAEVVVASGYPKYTVQLFDYSGNCLHTLDPPDDVTSWEPHYVCCSTTDEVFVVNKGDPIAVYRYIAGRVYMGCVTRDVDDPYGVALSHDDQILYVTEANEKMVKMFRRP